MTLDNFFFLLSSFLLSFLPFFFFSFFLLLLLLLLLLSFFLSGLPAVHLDEEQCVIGNIDGIDITTDNIATLDGVEWLNDSVSTELRKKAGEESHCITNIGTALENRQ